MIADISLCSNEKCEKWNNCLRGGAESRVGIHTVSNFEDCNSIHNPPFPWYIPNDLHEVIK